MANLDYLNWQTRMAKGCVDTRSGASNSGERGYYASNGCRSSQSTIDRHNDRVFRNNNYGYPDRLHGSSNTRSW